MKILAAVLLFFLSTSPLSAGYHGLESIVNSYRPYSLKNDPVLDQVAYCRATFLSDNNLWTHDGYELCFNINGVDGRYGEVLAMGFDNDYDIVTAWMISSTHRYVIMEPFSKIGSSKVGDYTVVTFR